MKKIIIGIVIFFGAIIGYQKYNDYQIHKDYEEWKKDHLTYDKIEAVIKEKKKDEEILYYVTDYGEYGLALTRSNQVIHIYRVNEEEIIDQKDYTFNQPYEFIPMDNKSEDFYAITDHHQGPYMGIAFTLNIDGEIHIIRIHYNSDLNQFLDTDLYIGKDGEYNEEYIMNVYHAYYPGGSYIKMIKVKDDPYIIAAMIKNSSQGNNAEIYLIQKYIVRSVSMTGQMTEDSELSYKDGTVYYSLTLDGEDTYESHQYVLDPRIYNLNV